MAGLLANNTYVLVQGHGSDETVLWEGAVKDKGSVLVLSETVRNFSKIKVYLRNSALNRSIQEIVVDLDSAEDKNTVEVGAFLSLTGSSSEIAMGMIKFYPVNETMTISDTRKVSFTTNNTFVNNVTDGITVTKVIGIGRKAGV